MDRVWTHTHPVISVTEERLALATDDVLYLITQKLAAVINQISKFSPTDLFSEIKQYYFFSVIHREL